MIFSQKHQMYTAVLLGEKTLTTRLKLPAHIAVGKEWAIVPGRAKPAWWFGKWDGAWQVVTAPRMFYLDNCPDNPDVPADTVASWLEWQGFTRARIRIDDFYDDNLTHMYRQDVIAEGVPSGNVEDYAALWNRINDRSGIRWADNPGVWRVRFSVPQDVCEAVSRVGRAAIKAA